MRNMQIKNTTKASKKANVVMVYLHKEKFPPDSYSKLSKRKIGPYRIIKKVEENAYVANLPNIWE